LTEQTRFEAPSEDSRDAGLTLTDYLRPAWRFKIPIVLLIIIAGLATYEISNRSPRLYKTATEMYVGESTLEQLLQPASSATNSSVLDNQAVLAKTPAVARAVAKRLGIDQSSPDALLGAVAVTPSSAGEFLIVTAETRNPRLTADLANGFAKAYLRLRASQLVRSARVSLAATQSQLQKLQKLATPITGKSATTSTTSSAATADANAASALQSQIQTLEGIVSSPPGIGQQIRAAPVPAVAVSPKPKRDAIFAAAIALVLGILIAYLVDRGDRRVRTLGEVDAIFEVPVLATVPHIGRSERRARGEPQIPAKAEGAISALRVNLEMSRRTRPGRSVIVVTSALADEGKSTLARNLALSYERAGTRVVLVEADFRRSELAEQFGLQAQPGLAESLITNDELHIQSLDGQSSDLGVVVAGQAGADPTVLLTGSRLEDRVARLSSMYEVVLIDAPPLVPVSDALPLLALSDGALIVVRPGVTTRAAIDRMLTVFARVARVRPVEMFGVVVNDSNDALARYGKTSSPVKPTADSRTAESSGLSS
jgi:capsular exopolysaccharide synthesis family protein